MVSSKIEQAKSPREKKQEVAMIAINSLGSQDYVPVAKFTRYLGTCLLIAAVGSAFQLGWTIAIFNVPETIIKDFYNETTISRENKTLDSSEVNLLWALTNGLHALGGIFGGFFSGFTADYFGRKKALIVVNSLVILTSVLLVISKFVESYETIMAARFFSGVYCGLFSGIFPMYLNECSPKNLRGRIGVINQLSIVIGILAANLFGLPQVFGTKELWPVLVGFTIIPTLVHIGLFFVVESPKYMYINKNNLSQTRAILMKLRDYDEVLVQAEIEELEEEKKRIAIQRKVSWADMFKRVELRRALIAAVGVQISQQLSGINAVIFYSTGIFQSAGLSWAEYATLLISAVQIVMTIVCMFVIDLAGRKPLLLTGMIGMSFSCFALALSLIFRSNASWLNYMTVVFAVLYIIFFGIGPGAIPWLITSELFESDSRGKATSIAVLINWSSNFIVVVAFPFISDAINDYSFIIFGVLLILFITFTAFFVPETKGKSTEDIVAGFRRKFIFFRS